MQRKKRLWVDFAAGKLKVLITTTVIEVGVNVPNATLMIVENADRFGLAQLHQLRGRVGRGQAQSFCVLLTDNMSDDSLARLQVLHESSDGFELSEKDLELRGAGQLFGLRQHGLPDLFVADILRDTEVLVNCRKDAIKALADKELRQQVMTAVENQFDERFSNIFKGFVVK
jgi:ATP-dependent DNA helicase RecG